MEEKVCTGACLYGKCPFEKCIKHAQKARKVPEKNVPMQILTGLLLKKISLDKKGYGIAVDIGTTTVAAYLYKLDTGEQLCVKSRLNAQAFLGVDVISRIKYCMDVENGLQTMQEAIVKEINSFIIGMANESGIKNTDINDMVVTGNTTMLHLLAGIDPRGMGHAPFEPGTKFGYFMPATELKLLVPNARVYLVDCISAFIGGDILCGILAAGMFDKEKLSLLLDIGTNGEVAFGNKHGILATSTAAGPAFEGSEIKHGMASVTGAITSISVINGKIEIKTIGDAEPKGICGSGIIDAIALFLNIGLIDNTGKIVKKEDAEPSLRHLLVQEDGMAAITVAPKIVMTQKDIRDIQTAKAAIAAGVLSLLHHAGKTIEDISRIYLAGGFGNFMDPGNAVRIGLLPKAAAGRIVPIQNAAGTGAVLALLNDYKRKKFAAIQKKAEHVELGNNPDFMKKYIECMSFEQEG